MGLFSRKKRSACAAQAGLAPPPMANNDVEVAPHQPPPSPTTAVAMAMAASPTFQERQACGRCATKFAMPLRRRHHCRNCGESCCHKCMSATKRPIPWSQAAATQKQKAKQAKQKAKRLAKGKTEKPQKPKAHKVCTKCDVEVFNAVASPPSDDQPASATVPAPAPVPVPVSGDATMGSPPRMAPNTAVEPNPADDGDNMDGDVCAQLMLMSQEEQKELKRQQKAAKKARKKARKAARKKARKAARKQAKKEAKERAKQQRPKGSKKSLWNLPIRPLLKRKESAEQLRNRQWDMALQKAAANGGSSAQELAVAQPCA
ncbi:TPA: hypothetical protein N0F65_001778 [Lagenidium giganteum]|uniref:FYVE-type domain-containing protein n=1 Tax=Lagenidium giganteum TaxID=4803 RepID=A0AAV2YGB3_9STRA|nr:TPA: hypothetical protein N0F65_001778 [Lagenidium giganteum]